MNASEAEERADRVGVATLILGPFASTQTPRNKALDCGLLIADEWEAFGAGALDPCLFHVPTRHSVRLLRRA